MRVMLANDTGMVNHVGRQGVSDAHARVLGRAGHQVTKRYFLNELTRFQHRDSEVGIHRIFGDEDLMTSLENVDAVVVNGEGTIHHGAGTEYLNLLAAAKKIGKKTLLVNCVLEEINGFDDILESIDDVVVRDTKSAQWLTSRCRKPRIIPDSYIEAEFRNKPILDLRGRVVVTDWHHARDKDIGTVSLDYMRYQVEDRPFFFPLMSGDLTPHWRSVPATLAGARAVVTGRHHGVYAALLADVPFIALSSNTYKVAGLLDPFPELAFCLDPPSIHDALTQSERRRDAYHAMREAILGARPLSTFSALGGEFDPGGVEREVCQLQSDCVARATLTGEDLAYRLQRRSYETCMASVQH